MGEIKSALEIALEKTEGIKGDKDTLAKKKAEEDGKRLASAFLKSPEETDIQKTLKDMEGSARDSARKGILQVLLANLVLPTDSDYQTPLENLSKGFQSLTKNGKQAAQMLKQISEFFGQYLQNKEQVQEQILQQFEPRIKQKEEELAKQVGTPVRIDPMQDPEYAQTFKQTMSQLTQQYQDALDQAKGELERFCS